MNVFERECNCDSSLILQLMLRFGLQKFPPFPLLRTLLYGKTNFKPVPEKVNFPQEEEKILKYWQQTKAFQTQLEKTKHDPPFSFYDGPPFATGTPHYGHIAAGTIKDVVCRYASQTGHYVQRRFGWDCHGLPVEYEIDKELKITDRRQVAQMGIEKYNQACRGIVMRYSGQWEHIVSRFGRWVDFQNDYKTMDISFMESVWQVFQQMYNKGLVYRGRKIMPYSNACSTVLSNFEVQQNYKPVDDPSVIVTFPLRNDPSTKLVAWTTTPWTLPSNLVLAVNPKFTYVKVRDLKRQEIYILAQSRLKELFPKGSEHQVVSKMEGKDMEGLQYQPLYSFFYKAKKDGCFRVYAADFVTDSDGTGIVHCAPGFGEDDYNLCLSKHLIHPDRPPVPVDQNGRFTQQVGHLAGIYIKDADDIICKELKQHGRLLRKGVVRHNYPFCWRSQTPLIYKAVSAWFIKVTQIKDDLVANNHKAYWVPASIQQKKFDNWLKEAKDWCFSRNRFWGNPIPLWVSDDGQEVVCVGSVKELEELTGQKVTDLHRESIDELTIESRLGKGKLRRIEEVFDCWFESGSMPFALNHYPFSQSEESFNRTFPADFIGEGIDQTRGWFYTLNVISTAVRNTNPYKNLIVNGLVLTESGKKMSKRLKNYPDPMEVCDQIGADAVRLYLINSPLVKADNLNFSKEGVRGIVRDVFLPWYNAHRFLILAIEKWEETKQQNFVVQQKLTGQNVTDRWIQSALQELIVKVRLEMKSYRLYTVVPALLTFLNDLTNWYLRLNRGRLKGEHGDDDWRAGLNTLFEVLFQLTVLLSPYAPFVAEFIYQNMRLVIDPQSELRQASVHHVRIPEAKGQLLSESISKTMREVMGIIQTARKLRQSKQLSLKKPIQCMKIISKEQNLLERMQPFLDYLTSQINVEEIKVESQVSKYVELTALPNLPVIGPKLKGTSVMAALKKAIQQLKTEQIQSYLSKGRIEILGQILREGDLLITEKFIESNLESYQAIAGKQTIILIDTRQDESLRMKGFARQLITRCQKLKKKAVISHLDDVLFLFYFPNPDSGPAQSFIQQMSYIEKSVKSPLAEGEVAHGLNQLAMEQGAINDEDYCIRLCSYGPLIQMQAMRSDFGEMAESLAEMMVDVPIEELKQMKGVQFHSDGKMYTLRENIHYRLL